MGALALLVCAQNAAAAGRAIMQRTDPQASSPAGVIYQIPLDTGRRDAAPVLPAGRRHLSSSSSQGGGATGAGPGGGGSSGAAGGGGASAGGSAGAAGSGGASPGGGTPSNPSSIHSENGFGSASAVPGVSPAALRIGAGVPAVHAAGSTFPSYLLMMLIGVAAIAVGLIASRGRGAAS